MYSDNDDCLQTKLGDDPQWTQLRIRALETLDTAFYSCVASNGADSVESTAIVKVNLGKVIIINN